MLKRTTLFLACIAVAGILAAGCSGGSDEGSGTQAPPPSKDAVPVPPKTDKNMPGARQATGASGPGAAGASHSAAKPPGM